MKREIRPLRTVRISWIMTSIHETLVAIGNVGEWLNASGRRFDPNHNQTLLTRS